MEDTNPKRQCIQPAAPAGGWDEYRATEIPANETFSQHFPDVATYYPYWWDGTRPYVPWMPPSTTYSHFNVPRSNPYLPSHLGARDLVPRPEQPPLCTDQGQATEERATEERATEERATEEQATEERATEERATEEQAPKNLPFHKQETAAKIMCDNTMVVPNLELETEGPRLSRDKHWICYRRNYFSVTVALTNIPSNSNGYPYLDQGNGQPWTQIQSIAVSLAAFVRDQPGENVELLHFSAKRKPLKTLGKCVILEFTTHVKSSDQGGCVASSFQNCFKRMQFKSATKNNGRALGSQQYFRLKVVLWAKVQGAQDNGPKWVEITTHLSDPVVVRGRPSSHYQYELPNHKQAANADLNCITSNAWQPTPQRVVEEKSDPAIFTGDEATKQPTTLKRSQPDDSRNDDWDNNAKAEAFTLLPKAPFVDWPTPNPPCTNSGPASQSTKRGMDSNFSIGSLPFNQYTVPMHNGQRPMYTPYCLSTYYSTYGASVSADVKHNLESSYDRLKTR